MRLEIQLSPTPDAAATALALLLPHACPTALEHGPGWLHLDLPGLAPASLPTLAEALVAAGAALALRESLGLPAERRRAGLERLAASLPDPILAFDAAERLVAASGPACRLLRETPDGLAGRSAEALLGQSLAELAQADGPAEALFAGRPFMLDLRPLAGGGHLASLSTPARLGTQMTSLARRGEAGFEAIIGRSAPMRLAIERARRYAQAGGPVLILGETGTGKELFARAIHQAGPRREAPFLALNCAAMPEQLVESELFGYAPGAFTGASRAGKPGLFELADGGTVFLDEIGEMSPYMQAKLLRVLQDGTFRRIGGGAERRVRLAIISATHRDLPALVRAGQFREDLYWRLAVLAMTLPPLRERREDIPLLAERLLARAAAQLGQAVPMPSPAQMERLRAAPWPGNVRQLENLLFRAAALGIVGGPQPIEGVEAPAPLPSLAAPETPAATSWEEAKRSFERQFLARQAPLYASARAMAAGLGVSHTMIAEKLKLYGISPGGANRRA